MTVIRCFALSTVEATEYVHYTNRGTCQGRTRTLEASAGQCGIDRPLHRIVPVKPRNRMDSGHNAASRHTCLLSLSV